MAPVASAIVPDKPLDVKNFVPATAFKNSTPESNLMYPNPTIGVVVDTITLALNAESPNRFLNPLSKTITLSKWGDWFNGIKYSGSNVFKPPEKSSSSTDSPRAPRMRETINYPLDT